MTRSSLSGYVSMGAEPPATTAITLADINSTKYPGICKPANKPTLEKFFELQRQLNRYSAAKGLPDRVGIDGDIGPGVVALVAKTTGTSPACTEIALQCVERTISMKAFADAKGIATKASAPVSMKVPTIVSPSGVESMVPAGFMAQFFGRSLSSTESVALVGLAGGIGYLLLTKKRKGRR